MQGWLQKQIADKIEDSNAIESIVKQELENWWKNQKLDIENSSTQEINEYLDRLNLSQNLLLIWQP